MTRAMLTEERSEVKVSRSVLKPSQKGDLSGLGQPTVLHELAHLYGFMEGYSEFDALVDAERLNGDRINAILDGEHLDKKAHPHDLLNTHLAPGIRKLPSELGFAE